MRGFSAYGNRGPRGVSKINNATALLSKHHLTFFQETNLLDLEDRFFKSFLPKGFSCEYSSLSKTAAGVATIISDHLNTLYTHKVVPLPDSLLGYALCIEFFAMDGSHAFTALNLYLDSSSPAVRAAQLAALQKAIPPSPFLIVGGDFNFAEDKYRDTASHSSHYNLTRDFAAAWTDFKVHFSLKEVFQKTHTFVSGSGNADTASTSRLDRFYLSYSEVDWAIVKPFAFIATLPKTILHSVGAENPTPYAPTPSPLYSDHFALSLGFRPPDSGEFPKSDPRIPQWVTEDPDYVATFEQRWRDVAHRLRPDDAFAILDAFKASMYDAAADIALKRRNQNKTFKTEVHKLTLLLKLLRLDDAGARTNNYTPLDRFRKAHPALPSDLADAREAIKRLLETGGVEDKVHKAGASRLRKPSAIDRIKVHLPSTRVRLHAMREGEDEDPSSDPNVMAQIAARYWTRIWAKRRRRIVDECIEPEAYFAFHQKRISADAVPIIPTIQDLDDAILQSKNSSAGPDGIAFAVWRALHKHAAPVLHKVVLALASGVLPPEGFNYGLLFLIPKAGTLLPSDTRPISVTNADNRIIAQAVVLAITPCLYDSLEWAQKGFISGRAFEDHIRHLNDVFYKAVEGDADENLFILFMDTAKAFDSVDHSFIMTALKRTGLPPWLVSLVGGLLHNVKVRPNFKGASHIWIDIARGVKQGCPLSPLLFVICYDVLLARISRVQGVSAHACADDLAVATKDFTHLWRVMKLVNQFRRASGLGINEGKTVILPARPCADLVKGLPRCPWPTVKLALIYRYLGILFGPEVTT